MQNVTRIIAFKGSKVKYVQSFSIGASDFCNCMNGDASIVDFLSTPSHDFLVFHFGLSWGKTSTTLLSMSSTTSNWWSSYVAAFAAGDVD